MEKVLVLFFVMVFLAFGGFLYLLYWVTTILPDRVRSAQQARVAEVNTEYGLSFDAEHILGDGGPPYPTFVAFDQQHRKLAICSRADRTFCRIEDFSWLRGWSHAWEHREKLNFTQHRIELETADPNCPVLFLTVKSMAEGSQWMARLNLLINE